MKIGKEGWKRFISKLRMISDKAAEEMSLYLYNHPESWQRGVGEDDAIRYAYALATKYGEAAAALACEMYDAVASATGAAVPLAEPAATATYGEVAKAVRGTARTGNPETVAQAVARTVKLAGVDTTAKNAIRDGAEFAWIPSGDTCAFCLTLASRGWQKASRGALKNGHAEHVHANCDCTYAVRFDRSTTVSGYYPERYLALYENAEGKTPQEKINAMRRAFYAQDAEAINAQKRAAYAARKERESQ